MSREKPLPPEGAARPVRTAAGHTMIEPPRSWTEGVQLPLIPVQERADRVPELTHYRDEGCRFWHACLTCPFPRCVFEEPGGPKRAVNARRNDEIRRLFAEGEPAQAIAVRFGIARRSVYRAIGGIRRREA